MIFYMCILFIICVDASRSIKGLYCQDPDTKKLYPVNATWRSESFCGNYTCKIRRKNHTLTEYTPITKINITEEHLKNVIDDMTTSPSEQVDKILEEEKQPILKPETIENLNHLKEVSLNKLDDNDRYLTDAEIKSIADILHTVRKSDLEAIVEIYNLAQDIYKEVDSIENHANETESVSHKTNIESIKNNDNQKSYFYKPLHQTHMENVTLPKTEEQKSLSTRQYRNPLTYFSGPLSSKDFGRLPYYYPMSHIHRPAPYSYNRPFTTPMPPLPTTRPCTTKPPDNYAQIPWYDRALIKPYMRPQKFAPTRPMLLPYPFSYVHNYNYNPYPASFYYNNFPWAQLNSYNRKRYSPYYGHIAQNPVVAIETEPVKEKESMEEIKEDIKIDDETLPDWQTEPLSDTVLEEVKANILHKSKFLKPAGKGVKLERVGKVIKINELKRDKRHVIYDKKVDAEEYEAYLEKTKCETTTEPGFFRVGNLSAPYPACCPQKIQ